MNGTSRGLKRRAGRTAESETIAIVCEGEKTEDIYFSGIRRTFRLPTIRLHIVGLGKDPVDVVAKAMEFLPGYDHVWAVFDVEAPQPHARLTSALRLADRNGIRCAVSNPCFEVWLLLHFKDQTAYLDNAGVRQRLKRCPCRYDDKGFDFAAVWPQHQAAIERAHKLHARQAIDHPEIAKRNPWTSVHGLVDQLLKLVPE
jgi:hypothetical protein